MEHHIVIIGGGPAGLMAAISAAEAYKNVYIFEKMPTCGKKLMITGKGRCNVTTSKASSTWISLVQPDGRFLYSALAAFDEQKTWLFFEKRGLLLKKERGDRVFPQSDKAQDVLDVLMKEALRLGVKIQTQKEIKSIDDHKEEGYELTFTNGEKLTSKVVIVATGGASYPHTGSDGIGFRWAQHLGIETASLRPALVPLAAVDAASTTAPLMGLSLRNVCLSLKDEQKNTLYEGFGEMLFTHFGLSGPLVLEASRAACLYWQQSKKKLTAHIDLKPALSYETLKRRILRERSNQANKMIKNALERMLPQKMIMPFLQKAHIEPDKVFNQLTKEEQENLLSLFKDYTVPLASSRSLKEAIVTAGGIETSEIDPKNMMCKSHPGLFFVGEVLNLDAPTGGYNLQIAFATGFVAGKGAVRYMEEVLCQ